MEPETQTFGDRLLWTIIVGGVTGLAAALAAKAAARVWMQVKKAPPPKPLGLLGGLTKKAGTGAAHGLGA
jgi:hypothetical protein